MPKKIIAKFFFSKTILAVFLHSEKLKQELENYENQIISLIC